MELSLKICFLKQVLKVAQGCRKPPKKFSMQFQKELRELSLEKFIFLTTIPSSMLVKYLAAAHNSALNCVCACEILFR